MPDRTPPQPAGNAVLTSRAMQVAKDAFVAIDRDSVIRDWNPAAALMFGWSAEEAIGRGLAETLIPPGLHDAHNAGIGHFLRTGTPRVMGQGLELTAIHRDGHELPIELTIWPAEVDGELRFRAFIRDISERLRRARYLEAHNGVALALTGADTLADGLSAAMRALGRPLRWDVGAFWRLQPDGRSLRAEVVWRGDGARNSEFERLTRTLRARAGHGFPGEVLRTGEMAWVTDMPGGGFPRSEVSGREELRTAVALPVNDSGGLTGVLEFFATSEVRPDPELLEVLEASCAVIGTFVERCRQRDELSLAHAAALDASRMKSEFLANTSHEIRTPLNGVIGMADLLQRTQLTAVQREYVETVTLSAQSLLAVINDILDFSKIEAGKLELDDADFALRDVVEEAVATFAQDAHAKGIELVTWIDASVPDAVRGDAGRLRQVLVNLVSNAVKFTPAGEVVVSAESVADDDGDGLLITFAVRDTGIGLESDVIEGLFESFAQADASTTRRYGGTGLGLAISRQLVELMGGEISVASAPGRGSTFRFDVRLGRGANGVGQSFDGRFLGGLRALVVDDNATNRAIVEAQLVSWDLRCELAPDAERALRLMERAAADGEPYDVAIVDLHMPGVDGLELCRRIQALPRLRATRLVMLTSGLADAELAAATGIAAHLTKPVRQTRLREAIAGVLAAPPTGGSPQPQAPAVRAGTGRVLVAEDHPVNQLVVSKLLEQEGLEVDVADDGAEALTLVGERAYAAVFMDCQMPVLDGYAATAAIRATDRGAGLPIIALTAHAMKGDRERCLAAGMDDYLAKPIVPEELARVLARWVSPSAEAESVLDAATVVRLREDFDLDTRRHLVDLFLEHAPQSLEALYREVAVPDLDRVRAEAHRLKGSCLNLGAEEMRQLCLQVETGAAEGPAAIAPQLEALGVSLERTRLALVAQLAS